MDSNKTEVKTEEELKKEQEIENKAMAKLYAAKKPVSNSKNKTTNR